MNSVHLCMKFPVFLHNALEWSSSNQNIRRYQVDLNIKWLPMLHPQWVSVWIVIAPDEQVVTSTVV